MSTLQHINSSLDHFWPEYQRRFPAFDKPEIVPAETLRGMAPTYMRRLIDQDPSSFYLFVHADPMRGDASRERMVEFVDDFFYEKLGMPSSYDVAAGQGGDLPREQAVDKEVMPARDDREYQNYFNQQMAAVDAQQAERDRQRRIDDLGFDPDDGNTIDVNVGDDGVARPASDTRAVGQAQSTAVGMPKRIWYAVDFHCPAGGMLGYNGQSGRLGGRRRPGGYLREEERTGGIRNAEKRVFDTVMCGLAEKLGVSDGVDELRQNMNKQSSEGRAATKAARKAVLDGVYKSLEQIVSKELDDKDRTLTALNTWFRDHVRKAMYGNAYLREAQSATPLSDIVAAYRWACSKGMCAGLDQVAMGTPAPGVSPQNAQVHGEFNLFIFKYADGTTTWVEQPVGGGSFGSVWKKIPNAKARSLAQMYQVAETTVMSAEDLERLAPVSEGDDADPEKMMKEFVEKKADGEVEEDEYRRPKNQPHNLHKVDEDGEAEDELGEADLSAEDSEYIAALTGNTGGSSFPDKNKPAASFGRKIKTALPPDEENFARPDDDALNESMSRFCDRLIRG